MCHFYVNDSKPLDTYGEMKPFVLDTNMPYTFVSLKGRESRCHSVFQTTSNKLKFSYL